MISITGKKSQTSPVKIAASIAKKLSNFGLYKVSHNPRATYVALKTLKIIQRVRISLLKAYLSTELLLT